MRLAYVLRESMIVCEELKRNFSSAISLSLLISVAKKHNRYRDANLFLMRSTAYSSFIDDLSGYYYPHSPN